MTAKLKDIRFNRALLGREHHLGTFQVTRELILAYCKAAGETNPIYAGLQGDESATEGPRPVGVAPPTFCSVFNWGVKHPDIGLEGATPHLMAGLRIEHLAPVRPGDTLEGRISLKDVYVKTGRSGRMVFVVWETNFTNQRGVRVATIGESFAGKFGKHGNVNQDTVL